MLNQHLTALSAVMEVVMYAIQAVTNNGEVVYATYDVHSHSSMDTGYPCWSHFENAETFNEIENCRSFFEKEHQYLRRSGNINPDTVKIVEVSFTPIQKLSFPEDTEELKRNALAKLTLEERQALGL